MGRIITNFDELIEGNYKRLSMGARPSGKVHLGTLITILNGMLVMQKDPDATLELQLMDLDFDNQRGNVFVPYIHRQGPEGSEMSARDYMREELSTLLGKVGNQLGVDQRKTQILYFSDFLLDPEALNFFTGNLTDKGKRKSLLKVLFDRTNGDKYPVSGICQGCHTSSSNFSEGLFPEGKFAKLAEKIETLKDKDSNSARKWAKAYRKELTGLELRRNIITDSQPGIGKYFLKDICQNKKCDTTEYRFDLRQPGTYNIHYLVDPIRDALTTETRGKNDLHIFGGDYGIPSGVKKIPRAERIQSGMEAVGLEPVDAYIGPMLMVNGSKMSKSTVAVNCGSIDNAELPYVVGVLSEIAREGARQVSYSQIQDRVNSKKKGRIRV